MGNWLTEAGLRARTSPTCLTSGARAHSDGAAPIRGGGGARGLGLKNMRRISAQSFRFTRRLPRLDGDGCLMAQVANLLRAFAGSGAEL